MAEGSVMAVQVTIYLTEGDSWHHRPLHLEILKYLREENVFGAVAFHAVAGFLGRGKVRTAHLVEAGAFARCHFLRRHRRTRKPSLA